MSSLLRDIRWGARALRATPAATLAAVLTIALGTGANTAVLAVAYGVLVKPLPWPGASRMAVVSFHAPSGSELAVPLPDIEEWRRRVRAFEATGAYSVSDLTIRRPGESRLVRTALVTPSFFDVLRVPPRAGRAPSAGDRDDWVVLGARLAGEHVQPGHDTNTLLDSAVMAGERASHVAAVMPAEFGFPAEDVAAWVPAAPFARIQLASGREIPRVFRLVVRLRDGVSLEQARGDAQRAYAGVSAAGADKGSTQVRTLDDLWFGKVRPVLNALVAAAILVLLVACANVATLLVSRAVAQARGLTVRLSLGATPWQLARGAFVESLLIAGAGSVLGMALAMACVRLVARSAAGVVPRVEALAIDMPVLGASVLVALGVTIICGLAPAMYAIRADLSAAFGGPRTGASRGARRTRRVLIVAQIATAIVLLSGAGLMARTFMSLTSDRAGAEPDHAVVVKLMLSDTPRFDLASRMPAMREMLRTVRALPGVEHAGIGTNVPPRVSQISFGVEEESGGRSVHHRVYLASVTSGFFEALGLKTVEGHAIGEADEQREKPVIVLSESAARLLSPDKSLVGGELPWPLPAGAGHGQRPLVAGIVADVKYGGLDAPAFPAIYTRWIDLPASTGHLLVRTSGDRALLAPAIRKALRDVDPSLALAEIRTLRQEYDSSIADRRLRVIPAAGLGALAIAVALVGLGGLLARAVAERRRELAIRSVLGASPGGAVALIMREGILLALAGLVVGIGAAAGAATSLRSLLYGVGPLDPVTFGGVAVFVTGTALLTSFLAARRAANVEPLELLRSE